MCKRFTVWIVLMATVGLVLPSCQSPREHIAEPEGWEVVSFECVILRGGTQERLYIDQNMFEHSREGQARGQKMRTVLRGTSDEMSSQVTWIEASGKERQDAPIPLRNANPRNALQNYQQRYFVGAAFPSEDAVRNLIQSRYRGLGRKVSFCNREAYHIDQRNQVFMIDERTGVELARYEGARVGTSEPTKQLVFARWKLNKEGKKGYYELRCEP